MVEFVKCHHPQCRHTRPHAHPVRAGDSHIPELERVILGGWIIEQEQNGLIEIPMQRVQDVQTGIRLALQWCEPSKTKPSS